MWWPAFVGAAAALAPGGCSHRSADPRDLALSRGSAPLCARRAAVGQLLGAALSLSTAPLTAHGAAAAADTSAGAKKAWLSGKSDPLRPTSKDKVDGTRKDPKYLSCLNNCVPRVQGPPGPDQKERSECFDICQDECCFTYQQCTGKSVNLK